MAKITMKTPTVAKARGWVHIHVFDCDPEKCPQGRAYMAVRKLTAPGKAAKAFRDLGSKVTKEQIVEAYEAA